MCVLMHTAYSHLANTLSCCVLAALVVTEIKCLPDKVYLSSAHLPETKELRNKCAMKLS